MSEHRVEWCEACRTINVVCGACNNPSCNGSVGMDGEIACSRCESAYALMGQIDSVVGAHLDELNHQRDYCSVPSEREKRYEAALRAIASFDQVVMDRGLEYFETCKIARRALEDKP